MKKFELTKDKPEELKIFYYKEDYIPATQADIRSFYVENESHPRFRLTADHSAVNDGNRLEYIPSMQIGYIPYEQNRVLSIPKQPHLIAECFYESENNQLIIKEKEEKIFSNFVIDFEKEVSVKSLNGVDDMVSLIIKRKNKNFPLMIRKSDVSNLYKRIQETHPECYLFLKGKHSLLDFQRYVSEKYREFTDNPNKKTENQYTYAGWIRLPNGQMRYLSGSDASCTSERKIASPIQKIGTEIFDYGFRCLNLSQDRDVSLLLFLTAHLGYTAKFFEDIEMPLQTVFQLVGPTGVHKTSIAKELYCIFNLQEVAFTATDRAIELQAETCHDATLLVDDLYTNTDKVLLQKAHRLLRMYGDSTGRKRSTNGGTELESVDTRYAVIITAENIPDMQQSAKLRSFFLELKPNSINEALLSQFQKERIMTRYTEAIYTPIEQYVSSYIHFLECHYTGFIEPALQLKVELKNFKYPRHSRVYKQLTIQSYIILQFALSKGYISQAQYNENFSAWLQSIENIVLQNQAICNQKEDWQTFVVILLDSIHDGSFPLSKSKDEYISGKGWGYLDGNSLRINPHKAFEFIKTKARNRHLTISIPFELLLKQLHSNSLISEFYEQKDHAPKLLKKIKVLSSSTDILCLDYESLTKLVKEGI